MQEYRIWQHDKGCDDMPSLIINFLNFLSNNKDLVKENLLVFIIGWSIFACIGGTTVALIYKYRIIRFKDTIEGLKRERDKLATDLDSVTMHYNNLKAVFDSTDTNDVIKALKSGTGRKHPVISSDNN